MAIDIPEPGVQTPNPLTQLKALREKKKLFDVAMRWIDRIRLISRVAAGATFIIAVLVLWATGHLTVKSLVVAGGVGMLVRLLGWRWQRNYEKNALEIIEAFEVPPT